MAKLGLLYLRGGTWGDEQVVPASWIREATTMKVRISEDAGYGYQFWIREFAGCDAYYALGRGGQYIVMVPDKDLVIVLTAKFQVQSQDSLKFLPVVERIVAGASGTCASNRIMSTVEEVAQFTAPSDVLKPAPVDMPRDVEAFFVSFEDAMARNDLDAVMALYSDRFYFQGVTKADRAKLWARLIRKIRTFTFIPEHIEAGDGGVHYRGLIDSNIGALSAEGFLVKESGRLILLGNPSGRPDPITPPDDFAAFIRSFGATLSQGSADRLPNYFSDRYLSNGFSKEQLIDFLRPFLPGWGGTKVVVSTFEPGTPVSRVDGVLNIPSAGRVPMTYLFGHVVQEDGKWKWYGNQLTQ